MYYNICEWAYYEREHPKRKPTTRRIARRRLARELRRDVEALHGG